MRTFYISILTTLFFCYFFNSVNYALDKRTEKEKISMRKDFNKYFNDCKVDGCIAVYDYQKQLWITNDSSEIKKETLPASTFKIINLLIALETKVIESENDTIKWIGKTDTVLYGYRPEIYHDMTVKEAFEVSAGWVFIELAKKIGKQRYKLYLGKCGYGNLNLSQPDADFWNFGKFAVSPVNQVNFLKNVYLGKVPFSKRNIEILKRVMITEKTNEYTIRSKTGWTMDSGINTGWWVGYVENKQGVFFFATRLIQDRKFKTANFSSCRKDITKTVLKELNILPK